MARKNKKYTSLSEELYEKIDDCWDVNYGPNGSSEYFSVSNASDVAEDKIREIALCYNKWYSERLEMWISRPLDFPEMEGDQEEIYNIFLSELYGK